MKATGVMSKVPLLVVIAIALTCMGLNVMLSASDYGVGHHYDSDVLRGAIPILLHADAAYASLTGEMFVVHLQGGKRNRCVRVSPGWGMGGFYAVDWCNINDQGQWLLVRWQKFFNGWQFTSLDTRYTLYAEYGGGPNWYIWVCGRAHLTPSALLTPGSGYYHDRFEARVESQGTKGCLESEGGWTDDDNFLGSPKKCNCEDADKRWYFNRIDFNFSPRSNGIGWCRSESGASCTPQPFPADHHFGWTHDEVGLTNSRLRLFILHAKRDDQLPAIQSDNSALQLLPCSSSEGYDPQKDACREINLKTLDLNVLGKTVILALQVEWAKTALFHGQGEAVNHTIQMLVRPMTDSRLSSLTFTGSAELQPTFVKSAVVNFNGVQYYSLTIPRLQEQPPFEFRWEASNAFASVQILYYPPVSDNGPVDEDGAIELPLRSPISQFTDEYKEIPFGRSRLVFNVTAEDRQATAIHIINIAHIRNNDSSIASFLPTLGRLSPSFVKSETHYSLLMRVIDPLREARLLYTLGDPSFASSTSRFLGPNAASSPMAALGTKLETFPTRACAYRNEVRFTPPYGQSTLRLKVQADDRTTTVYTIAIQKVSFRLLNLTADTGVLYPPFSPTLISYSLDMPNAVDGTVVRAVRADPNTKIEWRVQTALSRRGAERLFGYNESSIDPITSIKLITDVAQLKDLPLGPGSLSVTVHAADGSQATYTLLLNRYQDPTLTLARPTFTMCPSGDPSLLSMAPTWDRFHAGYELSLPSEATSLDIMTTHAEPTTSLHVYWQSKRIRYYSFNNTQRFSIGSISKQPALLQFQLVTGSGAIIQQYELLIAHQFSTNGYLRNLTLSEGGLTPNFHYSTFDYELELTWMPPNVSEHAPDIRFQLSTQHPGATLSASHNPSISQIIDGNPVVLPVVVWRDNGTTWSFNLTAASVTPSPGMLSIIVLAEDGMSTYVYRISIVRPLPSPPPPPAPEPNPWYVSVMELTLQLQIDLGSIDDLAALREQLAYDLAQALQVSTIRLQIVYIGAGSIVATVRLLPSASPLDPTPEQLVESLQQQRFHMESSPLGRGKLTASITAISNIRKGCITADGHFASDLHDPTMCANPFEVNTQPATEKAGIEQWLIPLLTTLTVVAIIVMTAVWWIQRRQHNASPLKALPSSPSSPSSAASPTGSDVDCNISTRESRARSHPRSVGTEEPVSPSSIELTSHMRPSPTPAVTEYEKREEEASREEAKYLSRPVVVHSLTSTINTKSQVQQQQQPKLDSVTVSPPPPPPGIPSESTSATVAEQAESDSPIVISHEDLELEVNAKKNEV